NRLDNQGMQTIEIKQHSSVLHPATKLLKEMILTDRFEYEKNGLLEVNFANAREVLDTNLNGYLSKKRSSGKIDMVVSLINAMRLWHEEDIEGSVYETDEREMGFLVI
ncbi:MAG TPA: phage terminase family protein, partial [Romboutsia timonensis]|nr:phage terminase family protein [Romboutsia timonensis]